MYPFIAYTKLQKEAILFLLIISPLSYNSGKSSKKINVTKGDGKRGR